ncbi:MAG: hypothetical protein DMG83_03400, partial [Acidobacteria bacterium]
TQTALRWALLKFARPPFGMAYRAQAILQGRYTPTPLIVPSQRFRFYAGEPSPFNVRKSERFMDKGWCGSCYLPDYAMTIQKSIVAGTKRGK